MTSQQPSILFLDDMQERHDAFAKRTIGLHVDHVYTAAEAISALQAKPYDQVFLDHDLSLDDTMCEPGTQVSKEPTGMTVVDHILSMSKPPSEVVVHSCNGPAAQEMQRRLWSHHVPLEVKRISFPFLLQSLEVWK